MSRKIAVNSFLILALTLVFQVSAQDLTVTFPPPEATRQPTVGSRQNQRRQQLQQRLQNTVDSRTANQVLQINDRMVALNVNRTDQMTDFLNRVVSVFDRLSGKINTANTNGIDTTQVGQALADARLSLDLAQAAVASQAARIYTIEATGSAGLRRNVGQTVSQLQADLRAVRFLVIQAKQKVMTVVRELARTGVGKIGQRERNSSEPALMRPLINP